MMPVIITDYQESVVCNRSNGYVSNRFNNVFTMVVVDGDGEVQIPISGGWNSYEQRAFTTGRRHVSATKNRPKGISQTLKVYGLISKKLYVILMHTFNFSNQEN